MMNIFATLPKFGDLLYELKRFNRIEPAVRAAQAAEDWEEERRIIRDAIAAGSESITKKYKMTVEVFGEENLPDSGPLYIVANHQSYADVLMMMYAIRKFQFGFIAKSEFAKYRTFSKSLELSRSLLIDRGDARRALATMNEAADLMNKGFSFVLFPEGTRSRSSEMHEFKPGSYKAAQKARVPVLPVTLEGGYRLLEEHNSYRPCDTKVLFHPVVPYGELSRKEQLDANVEIEATIRKGLEQLK